MVYAQTERTNGEIGGEQERTGADRYYIPGDGYKIREFGGTFSVSASAEIFEEPKKVEDVTIITGLEFEDFEGVTDADLCKFVEPNFTSSFLGQMVFRHKYLPRFKYTYENKDVKIQFKEKETFNWQIHEFNFLHTFRQNDYLQLQLNPIYKRIYIDNRDNSLGEEEKDEFLLQYLIIPANKTWEIFGQLDISTLENIKIFAETENWYLRFEFRKKFSERLKGIEKLSLTSGYFCERTKYIPSGDIVPKQEIYLDIGRDIGERWRDALRLEVVLVEDQRTEKSNIEANVFNTKYKLSYEVSRNLDISSGLNYSGDFSSLNRLDNFSVFSELEYFKDEVLRAQFGYMFTKYLDINHAIHTAYLKVHLFRFLKYRDKTQKGQLESALESRI